MSYYPIQSRIHDILEQRIAMGGYCGSGRPKGSKNKKKSGSKTVKRTYVRKPVSQLTPFGKCRRDYDTVHKASRHYCGANKKCYKSVKLAKKCNARPRVKASGILLGGRRRRAGVYAGVDAGLMLGGYYPM